MSETNAFVFIIRDNPSQVGAGRYIMTAHFMDIEVWVKFEIESHQNEESLVQIHGTGFFQMSDLIGWNGRFENFNRRIGDDDYDTRPIIKAAYTFAMEQAASKTTTR